MGRFLRWMIGILGGLGAVYAIASFILYRQMAHIPGGYQEHQQNKPSQFKVVNEPDYLDFDCSPYFMPHFETVSFPSRFKDIRISGWFIPSQSQSDKAVIVVHGYRSSKADPKVLVLAGMLNKNGFNVLLIDLQEHGQSQKEDGRTSLGTEEYADILGAYEWLESSKGFHPYKIGVAAGSMGAASTLVAFNQEPNLTAIWVDTPYSDIQKMIEDELLTNGLPKWLAWGGMVWARIFGDDFSKFKVMTRPLSDRPRHLFYTYQTEDPRIGAHHVQEVAQFYKSKGIDVSGQPFEGTGHFTSMFSNPGDYEVLISSFFENTL